MRYAGFWIRVVAYLIDNFISSIGYLIMYTRPGTTSLLVFIIGIANLVVLQGIKGQSIGKMIMGLQVIKTSGEDISIITAIIRYIGQIISAIILGIGYLMVAFTEKKQGLHDKIAGTYVIYKKSRNQGVNS